MTFVSRYTMSLKHAYISSSGNDIFVGAGGGRDDDGWICRNFIDSSSVATDIVFVFFMWGFLYPMDDKIGS